ncbi:MAG: hypothetical protein F6J98_21345 [Moorea sp. SIO4G2]|uniref:hypothetical protein n=1 Tax=unclassified Moorena TaxID=2683338 RepID=UPI0013C711D2|nr:MULTISPECIES: hypothetical protein [unclassified Moorena]NEO20515.1 hypothetical protein [Moorena sp. SIO4A5]NEO62842.1 hypothetical protein [Moorena sp. SIO4G2]NEQ57854.1 hypothetical protein [Moorena sp. SIO4A1]
MVSITGFYHTAARVLKSQILKIIGLATPSLSIPTLKKDGEFREKRLIKAADGSVNFFLRLTFGHAFGKADAARTRTHSLRADASQAKNYLESL